MTTTNFDLLEHPHVRAISRPEPPAPICYSLSRDAEHIIRILDREFNRVIHLAELRHMDDVLLATAVLKTDIKRAIVAEVCK